MTAEVERLYDADLLGISHLKEANVNLINMGRALRQAMVAQDDASRDRARTQVDTARATLQIQLAEGRKRIIRQDAVEKYEEFLRKYNKYNENVTHALAMLERERINSSEAARFISSTEFANAGTAADATIDEIIRIKEAGSKETIERLRQRADETRQMAIRLLIAGGVLTLGLGMLIGASIKKPNDRLRTSVEALAKGDVETPIPHTDYPNEVGIMARAIHILQGIYRKSEDTRWIKSHGAEITAAMQRAEDFQSLAQSAISRIAQVLNAGVGIVYVADGDGRLNMLASYGYRERKHLNNSFGLGEGLVGQCAMEKEAITLTAPKDYTRIVSGSGEALPACIAVLPVMHNDRVLGVLEIASFQQFTERDKLLLDAVVPALAVSMEIMDRNQRTRDLLVATREQAERMEKQAAQLEEQQVEMEAQQAELLETENWFRSIIETAPDAMLVANESGAIVLINPQAESLFGYAAGELVGTPLTRIMQSVAASGAEGVHKDGNRFPIVLSRSELPSRGRHGHCVSLSVRIFRD
jgi:PAS domain-containing protein